VLLTNRRCARLFFGPGDALEETDRIVDDVHSQHEQGGWSQLRYQRSVEKDVTDHLVHTAELAFDLYKQRGADGVLIGVPAELITEFKSKLHPYLKERIAGKISVDVENASLDDVCAAARTAITEHVMRTEREALDRLAQGVGTGGRGAAGIAEVLDALNQARVETLLISENFRAAGRVDFQAGLLLTQDAETGEPVENIVEPAIEKAIEQSASAMVVRHHTDLEPLGGIGAVLRF
jgi:peptide chain release factor subunit 1